MARVPGLELLAEIETEFPADADFAMRDTRKGREGQDRPDKLVSGRFYLAMPNLNAFSQLLGLWEQWERTHRTLTGALLHSEMCLGICINCGPGGR